MKIFVYEINQLYFDYNYLFNNLGTYFFDSENKSRLNIVENLIYLK